MERWQREWLDFFEKSLRGRGGYEMLFRKARIVGDHIVLPVEVGLVECDEQCRTLGERELQKMLESRITKWGLSNDEYDELVDELWEQLEDRGKEADISADKIVITDVDQSLDYVGVSLDLYIPLEDQDLSHLIPSQRRASAKRVVARFLKAEVEDLKSFMERFEYAWADRLLVNWKWGRMVDFTSSEGEWMEYPQDGIAYFVVGFDVRTESEDEEPTGRDLDKYLKDALKKWMPREPVLTADAEDKLLSDMFDDVWVGDAEHLHDFMFSLEGINKKPEIEITQGFGDPEEVSEDDISWEGEAEIGVHFKVHVEEI
jgi:hypothetical protein